MIDLGLSKLALIGAVALVVIGPEKLPTVARMAGTLFGRAQRYINNVKSEVTREMQMDELRKMQSSFIDAASKLNKTVSDEVSVVGKEVEEAGKELGDSLAEANDAFEGGHDIGRIPSHWELDAKRRDFRKKKLNHTSSLPVWYKRQSGRRTRVQSGAARVARYRPNYGKAVKFFD